MNTDTSWYEKLDKVHQYPAKFPLELASKYILEYSKPEDIVLIHLLAQVQGVEEEWAVTRRLFLVEESCYGYATSN